MPNSPTPMISVAMLPFVWNVPPDCENVPEAVSKSHGLASAGAVGTRRFGADLAPLQSRLADSLE